jgi:hypothetical protein
VRGEEEKSVVAERKEGENGVVAVVSSPLHV